MDPNDMFVDSTSRYWNHYEYRYGNDTGNYGSGKDPKKGPKKGPGNDGKGSGKGPGDDPSNGPGNNPGNGPKKESASNVVSVSSSSASSGSSSRKIHGKSMPNTKAFRFAMGRLEIIFLAISLAGAMAFIPHGSIGEKDEFQDHMLTEALLREVVEHMGKDFDSAAASYLDYSPSLQAQDRHLAMMARANKELESIARANKELEAEQLDYESLVDGNPRPSLRDQEYLQHSSLMGHQYVTGGAGEGVQRLKPSGAVPNRLLVKSDDIKPAYCNPPNPCPVGYTEDQGCITEFENTAAFSRDYQTAQRCMCDGEHMFSCPPDSQSELGMPFPDHKTLVSKKFLSDVDINPYLAGERLPIAAKKGFDVINF